MASEMLKFNIFTTIICKTIFGNIMLLKQSAQLPILKTVISQVNSLFLQKFTHTHLKKTKNLRTKQNESTIIETFHRKIDIVVE
jgi:hypothetical protein